MTNINYFSLGGQDEKGKYCGVLEIDDNIFLLNAGVSTTITNQFGITQTIYNLSYIKDNKDRVKALFIGTPKFQNIGALPFIMEIIPDIPIYTSFIGKVIIETWFKRRSRFEQYKKHLKPNIIPVKSIEDFEINQQKICSFKISNSIPNSYGWIFKNANGCIVFIDEYVINSERDFGFGGQIQMVPQHTKNNVTLLITGVGSVESNISYTKPQSDNFSYLKKIVANTPGRVFIACYDNDFLTAKNAIEIAETYNLKFTIYSNTFSVVTKSMIKHHLINAKQLKYYDYEAIKDDPNSLILITGNPDRLFHKMNKILSGEDQVLQFRENDTFILATVTKPGLELYESKLIDELSRNDIKVYKQPKTILALEAGNEDLKLLASLLRPNFVIPINSYYKDLSNYAKVVSSVIAPKSIKVLYNGEVFSLFNNKEARHVKKVDIGDQYIDNTGVLDIGTSILIERQAMTTSGVVIIHLTFLKKNNIFLKPQIETMGLIADDNDKKIDINKHLNKVLVLQLQKTLGLMKENKQIDLKTLKINLKKTITRLYERHLQKKPQILVLFSTNN